MEICKSLKILALSVEEQIKYLINLKTYPSTDELALQFDDAYLKFIGNYKEGTILIDNSDLLCNLAKINSILNEMNDSVTSNIWHVSSLNTEQWNRIRSLASAILEKDCN